MSGSGIVQMAIKALENEALKGLDAKVEQMEADDLRLAVRVLVATLAQRDQWKEIATFEAAVDRCLEAEGEWEEGEEGDECEREEVDGAAAGNPLLGPTKQAWLDAMEEKFTDDEL